MYRIIYQDKITGRIIVLLLLISTLISCHSAGDVKETGKTSLNINNSDSIKVAIIKFDETEHNFGKIYKGEQVGWFFRFRNVGKKDLLITNAFSSCGCTVPDYVKEPVHPGNEGEIKVIFDSKDRSGKQEKTITVESNAQNKKIILKITAEIINK